MQEKAGALLIALCLCAPSLAATKREIMSSRYMRYNFCMERGLDWKLGSQDQSWSSGYKLAVSMNQWGVTEPTQRAIESASAEIKKLDADCRRQNDIADQPRPR